MRKIAIYGAGGFGRELACHINRINRENPTWNIIGFFDDGIQKGTQISSYGMVFGGLEVLNNWDEPIDIAFAIGSPETMKKVFEQIRNTKISYPNIIVPGIRFNDFETFRIGKGNIINSDCVFSCDVALGDFNILNGSVILGHDVILGSYNVLMPSVRISGEVKIGNTNFFGVGSIVLQQIKIGNNVRLGAGSVLIRKPEDGMLYVGNPARIFNVNSV